MTNEEKIKAWCDYDSNNMDMYELIVADEREKMTDEQIADYLAYLSDKEKALVVLNYLLRGGITDDDLRGLRLQWIKDEREKMQGVDCNCLKCSPNVFPNLRFNVCPICGNKRCPHASDHNYECTNSNEPGQCKKLRIVEDLP